MGAWSNREITGRKSPGVCPDAGVFVNSAEKAELGEEILRSIGSARRSVAIINPLISDERLVKQVLAARERGVRVKIITELRENRKVGVKYPTRGFEVDDDVSLNDHFTAIRRLVRGRVNCRGMRYYAHAKVIVVDDEQLILSSANGTSNSMGWGLQPSVEAGIRIKEPFVVQKIATAIGHLWELCPFRLHMLEQDISLQESAIDRRLDFPFETTNCDNFRLVWSYPPHGRALRDLLVRLIRQAREKITCAALSFYETSSVYSLHTVLLDALKRGVRVTVIVRPEHFHPDQYPDPSTKHLLENGMRLLGISTLHAKGIVIDNNACAIFSGNINPYSLESDADSAQVEIGICEFEHPQFLGAYGRWLTGLEEASDFKYE